MLARKVPVGAEIVGDAVSFRVWAPQRTRVEVVLESADRRSQALEALDGYFVGSMAGISAGARYRYRIDGSEHLFPDPASRFQPEGPHGPSQVIDPSSFVWTDRNWTGCKIEGSTMTCDSSGNAAGDACGKASEGHANCTTDKKSKIVCTGGKYVISPCRGADGCKDGKDAVTCDMSVAAVGDSCEGLKGGAYACSSDKKALLECKSGKFAVNEQCFEYQECDTLKPFIHAHKAVLNAEYAGSTSNFCPQARRLGLSSMLKRLALGPWRQAC